MTASSPSVRVSIVIPCANDGEYLTEAVRSVTATARTDVELIVVDDGSTDPGTQRMIEEIEQGGIAVIRQPNRGVAAARNAGIASSRGAYVLPLDADNRIRPAYLARGIAILDSDPRVGVVYGDAEYFGGRAGRWVVGPFDRERLMKQNYIDACAMFRRDLWARNGGYDSTMPAQGFEDWDFWLGVVEQGWKFSYVPEVLFDYRVRDGSMIARAGPHAGAVDRFIASKHGALYRQAWSDLTLEQASLRSTLRNLVDLAWYRLVGR